MASVEKSEGVTPTENLLSKLCEGTFLKLWSYPNPCKDDGDEMCDLIAVFGNEVFLFFDRKSTALESREIGDDFMVHWGRWRRKSIDKQIKTALGAERYIRNGRTIYLDKKQQHELPVPICNNNLIVHKIVVAHGAKEACENFSDENISGSLAIIYGLSTPADQLPPFFIKLERDNPVHVFDSANLTILLGELDTVLDFSTYLKSKVDAIQQYKGLSYCAEEDLLAHYYMNFDEEHNQHFIGVNDESADFIHIGQGDWELFRQRKEYLNKKEKDKVSYLWDHLIQKTSQNALDRTLLGNRDGFFEKGAIHEMAKEPRFFRRFLAKKMAEAFESFPVPSGDGIARQLTYLPAQTSDKGYVFLQVAPCKGSTYDEYREMRRAFLNVACGSAKNKFANLKVVVGIAMEPPKYFESMSEDFALLECEVWANEQRNMYEEANAHLNFFKTGQLQQESYSEF
jgi:hypothetical protein